MVHEGQEFVVLRDQRADGGVLASGVLLALSPLVFPYGLDLSVFLILSIGFCGMLAFFFRYAFRKLYLSVHDGEFEIHFGSLPKPGSAPALVVPAAVSIAPVRFARGLSPRGSHAGYGCFLGTIDYQVTMLALVESREELHQLIEASPVMRLAEMVDTDDTVLAFDVGPWEE